jgi:hypothetical protein
MLKTLISQSNLPKKNQSKTGLQHAVGWVSKEEQSNRLADAIVRFLDWQSRQMQMKQDRKIQAMLTRLRNREHRRTDK